MLFWQGGEGGREGEGGMGRERGGGDKEGFKRGEGKGESTEKAQQRMLTTLAEKTKNNQKLLAMLYSINGIVFCNQKLQNMKKKKRILKQVSEFFCPWKETSRRKKSLRPAPAPVPCGA